jgi:hypothetical protein
MPSCPGTACLSRTATTSRSDARRFERPPGRGAVLEKEMADPHAVHNPDAAAFDADAGTAQCFTHLSQRAGEIFKFKGEVFHTDC